MQPVRLTNSILALTGVFRTLILAVIIVGNTLPGVCCTSMIVGGRATANGRPMLWKNRDTDSQHNFVERVAPRHEGECGYVALYNAGDSLLSDAWMGMNDAGFAIMNTASYNLAPDTASLKDMEGRVMSRALQVCRTVDDFARLLDTLPKPLGVQANFGVIDAEGNGAYFETDDYRYTPFYLHDTDNDVLVRTNYSETGNSTDGMGYIRCNNARHILAHRIAGGGFVPEDFTEVASRSYWHDLYQKNILADTTMHWTVDQDFIPRHSTSASVVIEGVAPGQNPRGCTMWTLMGYPGTGHVEAVTLDNVPASLRPTLSGWRSEASERSLELRDRYVFPIHRGSGPRYLDLDYLRTEIPRQRALSRAAYLRGRQNTIHPHNP